MSGALEAATAAQRRALRIDDDSEAADLGDVLRPVNDLAAEFRCLARRRVHVVDGHVGAPVGGMPPAIDFMMPPTDVPAALTT